MSVASNIRVGDYGATFRRRIRARDEDGRKAAFDLTGCTVVFRFVGPDRIARADRTATLTDAERGIADWVVTQAAAFDVPGTWTWETRVSRTGLLAWTESEEFEVQAAPVAP